jgi:hypothetical protein
MDQKLTQLTRSAAHGGFFQPLRFLLQDVLLLQPHFAHGGYDAKLVSIYLFAGFVIILFFAAIYVLHRRIQLNWHLKLILFFCVTGLFMTSDLSRPVYFLLPFLTQIQLPWRFLAVSTGVLPFIVSALMIMISQRPQRLSVQRYKTWIQILIIVLITLSYGYTWRHRSFAFYPEAMNQLDLYLTGRQQVSLSVQDNPHDFRQVLGKASLGIHGLFLTHGGQVTTTDVLDYLPKEVDLAHWTKTDRPWVYIPLHDYPKLEIEGGQGTGSIRAWSPGTRQFAVNAKSQIVMNVKTLYYPGWKVDAVDATSGLEVKPEVSNTSDGRIQMRLPSGKYSIWLTYVGTTAERVSPIITVAAVFLIATYLVIARRRTISSSSI